MMTTKTNNYECCMCGDHGLSYELFRCKVCHFRSQHRYCSNLYPKAESYRVCNWCLIQKDDQQVQETRTSTTTTPSNKSNSPSSQNNNNNNNNHPTKATTKKSNHHGNGPKASKSLQPTSPIKKPARSPEGGSPSGRKRISGPIQDQEKLRRTRSDDISNNNNNNNNNNNSSSRSSGGGGPVVIKHVFRNKVRRYKLLDEVSS